MSKTRTLGRYKLKVYTTMQPPQAYAALVTHRDTGDQWLMALNVVEIADCAAAVDRLSITEIEQWTTTHQPLALPKDPDTAPPFKHCDDYIDDAATPEVLRKFLAFARGSAHGQLLAPPHPILFADHGKTRVRVTMASRFGDVGITTDLAAEQGYQQRVAISRLDNFAAVP